MRCGTISAPVHSTCCGWCRLGHVAAETLLVRDRSSWKRQLLSAGVVALLLLVLAIVLFPAIRAARRAARHAQRSNNLKQIYLALCNFDDVYRGLPPAVRSDEAGRPLCSWRFQILPFVEAMMRQLDFGDRWDDPANRWLINMFHHIYCWSPDKNSRGPPCTNVVAITGPGTAFDGDRRIRPDRIPFDTVLAIEIRHSETYWMEPGDLCVDEVSPSIVQGLERDGVHVLFADGAVWFLSAKVPLSDLRKFFTLEGAKQYDRKEILGPYALSW